MISTFNVWAGELTSVHEVTLVYQQKESINSLINPENLNLEIPSQTGILNYSPSFKLEMQDRLKFVFRGSAELNNQTIEKRRGLEKINKTNSVYDLTDAYVEYAHSQDFKSILGLQVFQWGPAELLSPSNFIFHLNQQQKSFMSKDKGHGIVRFNGTLEDLNIVWMSEVQSQNQPPWRAEEEFEPSHLLKVEKNFLAGQNFVGLTMGLHRNHGNALGAYGVWKANDQWSLYFDGILEQGFEYFIPVYNTLGYYEMKMSDSTTKQLIDFGFRSEDVWDIRLEYIYNSTGWSSNQLSEGLHSASVVSPAILKNAVRFAKPGLELLEKEYLYFSVRMPDLGKKKDIQANVRTLKALRSSSITYQLSFEQVINDSMMAYGELIQKNGEVNQSMTLLEKTSLAVGFRWVM